MVAVIAVVVIVVAVVVAFWALRRGHAEAPAPVGIAPRPSRDPLEQVVWWPHVWGVEQGAVLPVGEDRKMIYDWNSRGDIPPAYVGAGRGHEL